MSEAAKRGGGEGDDESVSDSESPQHMPPPTTQHEALEDGRGEEGAAAEVVGKQRSRSEAADEPGGGPLIS